MAKGKKCPQCDCSVSMYALTETDEPCGSWVVYQCPKCKFEEKVFESK